MIDIWLEGAYFLREIYGRTKDESVLCEIWYTGVIGIADHESTLRIQFGIQNGVFINMTKRNSKNCYKFGGNSWAEIFGVADYIKSSLDFEN